MHPLLHVIPDLDPVSGGTVSALVGLALAQHRLGMQVNVVTTRWPGSDDSQVDRLREGGVSVTPLSARGRMVSIATLGAALRPAIEDAGVVHVHALWEELQHQACRLAQRLSKPYVVSPHGMLDPWSLGQGRWKKRAYLGWRLRGHLNRAAAIHCTTAAEARLIEPLGFTAPKWVIPNGVDLTEFASPPQPGAMATDFVCRFPQVSGRPIVLFLSRLHPKKGLDLLLPAFAACGHPEAILVLAGPGAEPYVAGLRAHAIQLGIADRVVFTGMLRGQERVAALRAADLFVLPSYQENFGIAVVEAMAAGTPAIISGQVNLSEELAGQGVGQVVRTEVGDLTRALCEWLASSRRRREAGQQGRTAAVEYGFPRVAAVWRKKLSQIPASVWGPTRERER